MCVPSREPCGLGHAIPARDPVHGASPWNSRAPGASRLVRSPPETNDPGYSSFAFEARRGVMARCVTVGSSRPMEERSRWRALARRWVPWLVAATVLGLLFVRYRPGEIADAMS